MGDAPTRCTVAGSVEGHPGRQKNLIFHFKKENEKSVRSVLVVIIDRTRKCRDVGIAPRFENVERGKSFMNVAS